MNLIIKVESNNDRPVVLVGARAAGLFISVVSISGKQAVLR
jgi:hypothetical protein